MSSQKSPRIVKTTLSNFVRYSVLLATLVGLFFYTSPMWSTRVLAMNLPYIVGFLGAVIVLAVLYVGGLYLAAQAMRWAIVSFSWRKALFAFLAIAGILIGASLVTTFMTGGWGGVLRDQLSRSFLPEGNLLLKGGLAGAHYLLLLIGLTAVVLWNSAQRWPAKFVAFVRSVKVRKASSDTNEVPAGRMSSPGMDTSNIIDGDEAFSHMDGLLTSPSR